MSKETTTRVGAKSGLVFEGRTGKRSKWLLSKRYNRVHVLRSFTLKPKGSDSIEIEFSIQK